MRRHTKSRRQFVKELASWAGAGVVAPSSILRRALAEKGISSAARHGGETLSLAGEWRFALNPDRKGIDGRFFERELEQRIPLPGSMDTAGAGPRNQHPPSLDGLYRTFMYEGPAWYQREIEIPSSWRGKRISLFLERTHWETRVWIDGSFRGMQDSLIAPHVYELGDLAPGAHRLTISVDNTRKIDLGRFVSINYEGTQTNWNGLIGGVELRATDRVWIGDVKVYPDVAGKRVQAQITIANGTAEPVEGALRVTAEEMEGARKGGRKPAAKTARFTAGEPRTVVEVDIPMGDDFRRWDEFSPALYRLSVSMIAKRNPEETMTGSAHVVFGMRDLAIRGTQFTMNGRPIFLRGTLECAIFPLTGFPPTEVEPWRRIYRIMKSHGLNFVRFHSWCPPEAAFDAADREGILIQAEGPQANVPAGRDLRRDAFLQQELMRIVETYGNHPSFCLMSLGNEFGGSEELLTRWVGMLIKADPRHLYSSASSAQTTPNRQFTEKAGAARGIRGPGTMVDFGDVIRREDRPLTGHEIGQWAFYPNFKEIPKYTGVLKAKNSELVRSDLEAKGMADRASQFFEATGRHATLLYKEEIEVQLRTPGRAGFSLLDLHDYPGQGTALVGVLDPFWDSKGFVTPQAHRRYCGPVVPLLRMRKRTYTREEEFTAEVDVAQFGPADMDISGTEWRIRGADGRVAAFGTLPAQHLATGSLTRIGEFTASLGRCPAPARMNVEVALQGTEFANAWSIWIFPSGEARPPSGVTVIRDWSEAKSALAAGEKVILFPQAMNPSTSLAGSFLPVFWSPVWFPNRQPNTMGILCDPRHPALALFPTDFHSDWQWWNLIQNSRSLILDDAPRTLQPVVRVIDNFARNHRLGNLIEAQVGNGRLILCTMNLPQLEADHPEARQLLRSLFHYASSAGFQPRARLETAVIDNWMAAPSARTSAPNATGA